MRSGPALYLKLSGCARTTAGFAQRTALSTLSDVWAKRRRLDCGEQPPPQPHVIARWLPDCPQPTSGQLYACAWSSAIRASRLQRATSSPAGSSAASGYAWPAQRLIDSASPAAARGGAQRRGQVVDVRVGAGAAASCSRMKSLTMPRARRPLKARVSAVAREPASASRCGLAGRGLGAAHERRPDLGGARRPRPARRRSPAPSAIPPAATSGSPLARATRRSSGSSAISPRPSASSKEPRWPPASTPCTISASAPTRGGEQRLVELGDGHPDGDLALVERATTSGGGQPKVNDTTGRPLARARPRASRRTRRRRSAAAPRPTPWRAATGSMRDA